MAEEQERIAQQIRIQEIVVINIKSSTNNMFGK